MNQRDATVAVISYFRERSEGAQACSEDKTLERAVRVLEKRADVLRVRLERRRALPPPDILAEPLALPLGGIISAYNAKFCVICHKPKEPKNAFCVACFNKLDPSLRAAFKSGATFYHAFNRASRFFKSLYCAT